MHILGIPSYPLRWRRFLWAASVLDIVIILQGIGTLLWFLAHPSEPGNRDFLFYSLERWILILGTTALILGFLFALWAIKFRATWVENALAFFEPPEQANRLVASATFLFVFLAALSVWLTRNEDAGAYFARIFPLLLWGLVILAQAWIFLVAVHWKAIVKAFQDQFPLGTEKQIYPLYATNRYLFLAFAGISLAYLVLQLLNYLNVRQAVLIGDSWSYLYGASLDLNDPAFFSERRPWGILLIFKILGSSQAAIDLFQLSISTLAWLWLAWTFTLSTQNEWMKLVGLSGILGFSLTPAVQVWNHAVLSESLSISLMVLILAAFLVLSQGWKWCYLFLLIFFFIFWMSIREANAYVAIFIAFTLIVAGLIQRRFRVYWLLSFFIGLIFLLNYQLSSAYGLPRWALPLAEVITKRILPDQDFLRYFAENGMPVTPELMALSGKWANSDDYAVINSTRLKKFTRWLFNESRDVYARFLIAHPVYTITSPIADAKTLLGSDYFAGIPVPGYAPPLPAPINELFYPINWFWIYFWLALIFTGYILATGWRANRSAYWLIVTFSLLSIPHLYLVWHGDALDVERHAALGNIQFHLGILLLIVFYLDSAIANRAPRSVK